MKTWFVAVGIVWMASIAVMGYAVGRLHAIDRPKSEIIVLTQVLSVGEHADSTSQSEARTIGHAYLLASAGARLDPAFTSEILPQDISSGSPSVLLDQGVQIMLAADLPLEEVVDALVDLGDLLHPEEFALKSQIAQYMIYLSLRSQGQDEPLFRPAMDGIY